MPEFLAEQYQPGATEGDLRRATAMLGRMCDELSATGVEVKLLSVHYMPSDEAAFFQFKAETVARVADAAGRAGVTLDRITETVPLGTSGNTVAATKDSR